MSDIAIERLEPVVDPETGLTKDELEAITKEQLVDVYGQEVILLEDCVVIKLGDNNKTIEKKITYEDFQAIMSKALDVRTNNTIEGFSLPSNCFYFAKSGTEIQLSCFYAETIAEIKFGSGKYKVKFPNVIISHKLRKMAGNNWQQQGARYFVTDKKVSALSKKFIYQIDNADRVWLFPFPNTYGDGSMCYGGNSMPFQFNAGNLAGLNWYYQFLFESPFNADLGLRAVSGESSITGWLEKLSNCAKEEKPFPYENLRGYSKPV